MESWWDLSTLDYVQSGAESEICRANLGALDDLVQAKQVYISLDRLREALVDQGLECRSNFGPEWETGQCHRYPVDFFSIGSGFIKNMQIGVDAPEKHWDVRALVIARDQIHRHARSSYSHQWCQGIFHQ